MADKFGKLSQAETVHILEMLNAKVKDKELCPGCGMHEQTLMDNLITILPVSQQGFVNSVLLVTDENPLALKRYIPCIGTVCANCGNIQVYSLNVLKAKLDPIPSEPESKSDGK